MHQYMGEAGMAEHKQLFSNQMSLPALDYGTIKILNKTVKKKDYKQLNQYNTPAPKLLSKKEQDYDPSARNITQLLKQCLSFFKTDCT